MKSYENQSGASSCTCTYKFFFPFFLASKQRRTEASDLLFSGESESKFGALVRNSEYREYRSEIESENPRSATEGRGRRGKEDG